MADQQPTFQQAMEITAAWLQQWDNEEISDEVLADRIGEMVASRDGARGFFVVSLAGESVLMDRLPDAVVGQLRGCLLYTSPSPRDLSTSRMPSSA